MSEMKDWCKKPEVCNTLGNGWCVRISGTDVFDSINQYGFKTLRTFDIVRGLSSEEEAKAYLTQWLTEQIPDFDAQRLRAAMAEAELDALQSEASQWKTLVGAICATIPLTDTLKAAATKQTTVDYFKALHSERDSIKRNISSMQALLERAASEIYSLASSLENACEDFEGEEDEDPHASGEVEDARNLANRIRAALNPNPEAESHE